MEILGDNYNSFGEVAAGHYFYYEMPLASSSNFSVYLEPCDGDVDLYASDPTYLPRQSQFQYSSTNTDKIDHIESKTTFSASALYVGVFGRSVYDPSGRASYIIRSKVGSSPENPPELSDSSITTDSVTAGEVTLRWSPATSSYPAADLAYTVYFAPAESKKVMYTQCGLENKDLGVVPFATVTGAAALTDGKYTTVVKGLKSGSSYDFNVLVKQPNSLHAVYNAARAVASSASVPSDGGIPMSYVLGIGLPLFVIIIGVVVYLFVRNRKLTKELDVEMHDVPKSAVVKAVRGPPGAVHGAAEDANAKKYSRLLTEDDADEGDGTTYDPPEL